MFTVCPKCTLSLAVTASDLRIGQGYVRCGRCANVFNALLTLSEEPAADTGSTQPNLALRMPHSLPEEPDNAELADAGADTGIPQEFVTANDAEADLVESHGTGTFETIVLEGDGILQTEEFLAPDEVDDRLAAVTRQLRSSGEPTPGSDTAPEPEAAAEAPARHWPWVIALSLLLLLLSAQAIHHWRNQLAARPGWYGPLVRLYATLGLPLNPEWDLGAYDVRQLGANNDGTGDNAIHVRVSIANRSARSQPVPVLRLTLLDRYGKRIAARDLQPREYLPRDQQGRIFMDGGQRIDNEVAVVDPGPEATSFELDVCLVGPRSALRCAGDAAPSLPDAS
jgi:predicted Zn finger-like uncharacterized protein